MQFATILIHIATLSDSELGSPFSAEEFQQKIFPNGIYDFLIQLIAFILLLLIVFFFGYKPVKAFLKKRADYIEQSIAETQANRTIAQEAASRSEQVVEEGKGRAEEIIAQARQQATLEAEAILTEARRQAEQARRQADIDIEIAKEKSKQQIRDEIVSVAMLASAQLLGREVGDEDNRRFVGDFVDSLTEEQKRNP